MRRWTSWWLLVVACGLASCTYDASLLSGVQCNVDTDCLSLGDDLLCRSGYCQRAAQSCTTDFDCQGSVAPGNDCARASCVEGACEVTWAQAGTACGEAGLSCAAFRCDGEGVCVAFPEDAACDNALFCDGEERCDPNAALADALGCVSGDAPVIDDGVACTLDRCDEVQERVVHDDSGCACASDNDCVQTCMVGRCEVGGCVFVPAPEGALCEDEFACTLGESCDGAGGCVSPLSLESALCDDGLVCSGEELCQPGAPGADGRGCLPGVSLVDRVSEEVDPCVVVMCTEDDGLIRDESACCTAREGAPGSEACADEVDNDCDGLFDGEDEDCQPAAPPPGLLLWLDAMDASTINEGISEDEEDEEVGFWRDKSGLSHHARAEDEDWRPEYEDELRDDLPGLRFDGSNDRLHVDREDDFDFTTQMALAVVFYVDEWSAQWQALVAKGDSAWRLHRDSQANALSLGTSFDGASATNAGFHETTTTVLEEGRWYLVVTQIEPADQGITIRTFLNGVLTDEHTANAFVNRNNVRVALGYNETFPDERHWDGGIGEVMIFDRALQDEERGRLMRDLMLKWRIVP